MTHRIDGRLQRAISSLDDEALIERVRSGDHGALAELYRRHAPSATRAARSFTRSPYDADDVVADVFSSIWVAIRNGRGPADRFEPYLIAAVRNRSHSVGTKTIRTASADERSIIVLDRDPVVADVAGSVAGRAFHQLTAREREMLWLTAVEGRTSPEAGREMALTRRAAATLKFRAKQAFAEAYLTEFAAATGRPECHGLARKLSGYVRGSCRSRARRAVDGHLQTCPTCRNLVDELADVNTMLRSLGLPAAAAFAGGSAARGWQLSVVTQIRRMAMRNAWLKPATYVATVGTVALLPATAQFGTDGGVPDPQAVVIDASRTPTDTEIDEATRKPPRPRSVEPYVEALRVAASGTATRPTLAEAGTPSIDALHLDDAAATNATPAPTPVDAPAAAAPPPTGSSEPASTAPTPNPTTVPTPAPAPVTTPPPAPVTTPPPPAPTSPTGPGTESPGPGAGVEVRVEAEVTTDAATAAADVEAEVSDDAATIEASVAATVAAVDVAVDADAAVTADEDSVDIDVAATVPAVAVGDLTVIPELTPAVTLELPLRD